MSTEAIEPRPRWRQKCRQWARRYLAAEIVGTVGAFTGTTVINALFADRVLAALAGTVGEAVGFYGLIATVEWRRERTRGYGRRRTTLSTARLLLAEFGLIEVLDSLVVRPLFMYLGPGITGGLGTGTLLGKLMADVVFYGVAIVCYELVRRRRRETAAPLDVAAAKPAEAGRDEPGGLASGKSARATSGKPGKATGRAAPVKATPVKATPVKAEPLKAEPLKAEPLKAEPVKAAPGNATRVKGTAPVKAVVR